MSEIHEQKCPACDGRMKFNPVLGKLECDFCGSIWDFTPGSPEMRRANEEQFAPAQSVPAQSESVQPESVQSESKDSVGAETVPAAEAVQPEGTLAASAAGTAAAGAGAEMTGAATAGAAATATAAAGTAAAGAASKSDRKAGRRAKAREAAIAKAESSVEHKYVPPEGGEKLEIETTGASFSQQVARDERDQALEHIKPLPIYCCKSCGAEVIVPAETTGSLTCPYCQNNIVLTQQFSGTIKPDGIIPFKIDPKHLHGAINKFFIGKPLLTRQFFTKKNIGKIQGVYVPFWLFDCKATGDLVYHAEKTRSSSRSGDYIATNVDNYRLERGISVEFEKLAVDASQKMNDALMDSVCPFDYSALVPFDDRYLAGYVADRFDQTSQAVQNRNDRRVAKTVGDLTVKNLVKGYENVKLTGCKVHVDVQQAKYVLLPVYLLHVEYDGRKYHFAVNGQTGRVVGTLPQNIRVDTIYKIKYFAVGFGAVAAALFLLFCL